MKCFQCGETDRLNEITGLSFQLSGVEGRTSVAVSGIHCGHCGFLGLTMNGAAAPAQVTVPIKRKE